MTWCGAGMAKAPEQRPTRGGVPGGRAAAVGEAP